MRIGRIHLSGPQAWPDHMLEMSSFGFALQAWRLALGLEVCARRGRNPWVNFYLGWWAFEIYIDASGEY